MLSVRPWLGRGVGWDGGGGNAVCGFQEAFGETHGEAAGGDVDGVEPGADEGYEDGFGGGFGRCLGGGGELNGEERGGVFKAAAAVGAGGKFDVGDGADGESVVEDGAADKVADEEGVGIEGGELVGGEEELLSGEVFGGGDGVAAGELEDDAASVFASGEPDFLNVERKGVRRGSVGGGGREEEVAMGGEDVGEVGEGVSEELAAAALGTEQTGDGDPAGGGDAAHSNAPFR